MLVPLVVALTLASAGPAAPSKKGGSEQWVALVRVHDAPASWSDALRGAAEEVKEGGRVWVPPPAVSITDAQLALGCADWNDACAGQVASMTGAAMALAIDVNGAGPGVGAEITVQRVKAGGAGLAPAERIELQGKTPTELKLAKDFVRIAARGASPAILVVDADVPGTEVLVDGQRVGETPWRGVLVAGDHELGLRGEGKAPLVRRLVLKPGATVHETHSMTAAGPAVEITPTVAPPTETHEVVTPAELPPPTAAEAPPTTTIGWSMAGVGGALGAAGVVFLGATVYDLTKRADCGGQKNACVPDTPMLFNLYRVDQRSDFFAHQTAWITGSVAALVVGGLVVGTGVVLATGEPEEGAPTAVASGR